MNATTTVPTTIQLSRKRLTGLMLAAAGLAAVVTWALLVFAVGGESAAPSRATTTDVLASLSAQERLQMIELAAYFRAERRGFTPGRALEDWLAAEAEIDTLIAATAPPQRQ